MKIMADIPVEETHPYPGATSFRGEVHEVEVVRLVRWNGTSVPGKTRYHYQADIADHPAMCAGAIRTGPAGEYRVNVVRSLNKSWKPPAFPAGSNVFEVPR